MTPLELADYIKKGLDQQAIDDIDTVTVDGSTNDADIVITMKDGVEVYLPIVFRILA